VRVAGAAGLALAAGWWLRHPAGEGTAPAVAPRVAASAFVRVSTAPLADGAVVRTAASPSSVLVSTRDATGPALRVSEDEMFALAGTRAAGLQRLADGSARWMWLDGAGRF
jgi:hypothetical protein